jgi:hypothetical protein
MSAVEQIKKMARSPRPARRGGERSMR